MGGFVLTIAFIISNMFIAYFIIYHAVKRAIEENLFTMEDVLKRAMRDELKEYEYKKKNNLF
ncbi:hypothetical protein [Caloramator mitchellensis]|nr:hypothetical protein [Caloramator mitchellensis]